jgi:hypothetical protein
LVKASHLIEEKTWFSKHQRVDGSLFLFGLSCPLHSAVSFY